MGREINRFEGTVEVSHSHLEPEMRAPCHGLPNAAHSDDAKRFAGNMCAQHKRGPPTVPFACTHQTFAFTRTTAGRKNKGHCNIGRRVSHDVRRVGHRNTSAPGGLNIDMVISDPKVADHFTPRVLVKDGSRKIVAQSGENSVILLQCRLCIFCGQTIIAIPDGDIEMHFRCINIRVGKFPGHQKFHQCKRPPMGTSLSGAASTTPPLGSMNPRTNISDMNFPI